MRRIVLRRSSMRAHAAPLGWRNHWGISMERAWALVGVTRWKGVERRAKASRPTWSEAGDVAGVEEGSGRSARGMRMCETALT